MDKVKNSTAYEAARRNSHISGMIKAMQGWDKPLGEVQSATPKGKFGRVVIVECGNLSIDGSEFDIDFDVPFDDNTESEEATITIYNLADSTIAQLKTNDEVTITAGYIGDTGIIFTGRVIKVLTKWSGLDKVTTITARDSYNLAEQDVESLAFSNGVKASYILRTLVEGLGLPIAVFNVKRDHTYDDGVTIDGGRMAAIKQYAGVCGVSAYINQGKIYVRHISEGDNIGFSVNVDTGMLGSPEEFTEEQTNEDWTDTVHGMKLKMLLDHRVTTAAIVELKSRNHSGMFRVREGKHTCTSSDFSTEITCVDNCYVSGVLNPTKPSSSSSSSGNGGKVLKASVSSSR